MAYDDILWSSDWKKEVIRFTKRYQLIKQEISFYWIACRVCIYSVNTVTMIICPSRPQRRLLLFKMSCGDLLNSGYFNYYYRALKINCIKEWIKV